MPKTLASCIWPSNLVLLSKNNFLSSSTTIFLASSFVLPGYLAPSSTYSAIASILVNTFVHIIKVFIDGFYKDESYLTHTLPVTKKQLLISKYLSSLIVILSSVVVCFLSFFIMYFSSDFIDGLRTLFQMTVANLNISVELFVTIIVLVIFAQICSMISMSFTAIIKANTYNHKRLIKGLIWFAFFYLISTVVTLIITVVIFAIGGILPELASQVLSQKAMITICIEAFVLYFIYAFVYYAISNKLFNKGVNVD
jgi:hypothetical protein